MTLVSNDPIWWPSINAARINSYFLVAGCAGLIYDCVLGFGHEVELVWRQRWSLMTVLYLSVRYLGIICAIALLSVNIPTIPTTHSIMIVTGNWSDVAVTAILSVITVIRLHAMYQRRKMLIFLFVIFLGVTIANSLATGMMLRELSSGKL
ncbi:uncharacterized protein EDB93DRAFT_1105796 [Suillus bovinus]|uniref:uncharacterized protein n=1 Tax=Suillus bovinus TaxID=48563 RepID=UPI001B883BD5|nr:uncharacterized protein EDB93DRAFT_1105796 [Suillus bovinus]KAG2141199.1 hypothetical protein EDB93DRAFT_1105796 [Suillus bovinus]